MQHPLRRLLSVVIALALSGCASGFGGHGLAPQSQRFDLYDAKSNRIGYGTVTGGTVNLYDIKSNRLGTIRTR